MDDLYSKVPDGTEWCPECNGDGSSLFEETERCTRCGGSGLVMIADQTQLGPNGRDPARPERQD
jgi:DnaJ-class molecular chaperone